MIKPKITNNLISNTNLTNLIQDPDTDIICSYNFHSEQLYNIVENNVELNNCILKNIRFINSTLTKLYLVDCILDCCDLSNANLENSTFKRVEFLNSKLSNANLYNSYFENIHINSCNCKNTNLNSCSLYNCEFENSDFSKSDISNINFKKFLSDNCNYSLANFSNTKLANIDLSNNIISGIIVYPKDLYGVYMNNLQALEYVKLLGINIK